MKVEIASSWWDYMVDLFTILSALVSTILVVLIYKWQKKDEAEKERLRWKSEQINNFLIAPKQDYIREVFNKINEDADLLSAASSLQDKSVIYDYIDKILNEFNAQFIDLVYVIDKKWYNEIVDITDAYRDSLSHYLFDESEQEDTTNVSKTVRQKSARWQTQLMDLLLSYRCTEK